MSSKILRLKNFLWATKNDERTSEDFSGYFFSCFCWDTLGLCQYWLHLSILLIHKSIWIVLTCIIVYRVKISWHQNSSGKQKQNEKNHASLIPHFEKNKILQKYENWFNPKTAKVKNCFGKQEYTFIFWVPPATVWFHLQIISWKFRLFFRGQKQLQHWKKYIFYCTFLH